MKDVTIPLDGMMKAVLKGSEKGCDELVLSGGEPTLYPEFIIELISHAEAWGYKKYIIQTNVLNGFEIDNEEIFFWELVLYF